MKRIVAEKTFSRGIAIEEAYVVEPIDFSYDNYVISEEDMPREFDKFESAVKKVSEDLIILADDNKIFEGLYAIVNDYTLHNDVKSKIEDLKNVQMAVSETISYIKSEFEKIDDEYMRDRADDVVDVGNRLIAALSNKSIDRFSGINKPVIIIAKYLTPSDTALFDLNMVKGFITECGGVTSHVSIISRSMGIPALVGVKNIMSQASNGDLVAMNASTGEILINPDDEAVNRFKLKKESEEKEYNLLENNISLPATTVDNHQVKVYVNISSLDDIDNAMQYNIKGVGLFRTEFVFMKGNHFPTEEEQYEVYKEAIIRLNKVVIFRTLDIGGDKRLSYYELPHEENPFLGLRGVRFSINNKDIFKTQLRALLRASAFGKIKIMIPMVISCEEIDQVNKLIEACKEELREENIKFNSEIPVGIMIETPAAVLNVDQLAKRVDFFSIGTNDLTQYILAVDRGNEEISSLYNSFHPAVLRAINKVIKEAHKENIEVGMCGEFASDPMSTEILLGFGLDEFSISPSEMPVIKDKIRNLEYSKAIIKSQKILECSTIKEVMDEITKGEKGKA